jgi:hypothetical protein
VSRVFFFGLEVSDFKDFSPVDDLATGLFTLESAP